jgi:anti-sigma B factor antagonist
MSMSSISDFDFRIQVRVHTAGTSATVLVSGELDVCTAVRFRQTMLELLDHGCRDLTLSGRQLNFIDAFGLSVLVQLLKRIRADGGRLRLSQSSEPLRRLLQITNLQAAFGLELGAIDWRPQWPALCEGSDAGQSTSSHAASGSV